MSKHRPIESIVKICVRTGEKDLTTRSAMTIARREVKVIVIPVLNAPNNLLFSESSVLFKSLVVSKISVSTE